MCFYVDGCLYFRKRSKLSMISTVCWRITRSLLSHRRLWITIRSLLWFVSSLETCCTTQPLFYASTSSPGITRRASLKKNLPSMSVCLFQFWVKILLEICLVCRILFSWQHWLFHCNRKKDGWLNIWTWWRCMRRTRGVFVLFSTWQPHPAASNF